MKFTIDKLDGIVAVDGVQREDIDLTQLPTGVIGIKWFGTYGDLEYTKPDTPTIRRKLRVVSYSDFQPVLDAFNTPVPPPTPEQEQAQTREAAKRNRAAAVNAITVTTAAGNTFDGDETSQTRMARAIIALQGTGTPSTLWVLTNNTTIEATVAELTEALALAGAAQSAAWVLP